MRRRLALDIGIRGNEDFLDRLAAQARHEVRDVQVIGHRALHRVDNAAENVVEPLVHARTFDCLDITRLGDDADGRSLAL